MKKFLKYLKIYIKLSLQSLKILLEYKIDFLIGLSGFLLLQICGVFTLKIIFESIPNLDGWSYYEVLFIYAFAQIPRGLDHMLSDNLWGLSLSIVRRSLFDKYLMKPINPLFYLIAEKFQTDAFGELIVGIILLGYSINKLKISISIQFILLLFLYIICGTVIYFAIKLIFASLAFWMRTSGAILNMVYSISDFAKYPVSIYPKAIRVIISIVIPFAFTSFFPASCCLRKDNVVELSLLIVFIAICLFKIAIKIWNMGINKYESAGN